MKFKHLYFYVGTTAELIKIAPVISEFKRRNVDFKIIAAGQNKIKFDEFKETYGEIKADILLPAKEGKSSILMFIYWSIRSLIKSYLLLRQELKDKKDVLIIIHGDTVSSFIGSLVSKLNGAAVAHVESGLRSFDFMEPFPEEISRFFVSRLADIHFCPNSWSMKNLRNISGKKVNTRQNTLIESYYLATKVGSKNKIRGKYFVMVVHRQENILFHKKRTRRIIKTIIEKSPANFKCAIIMHELTRNFINSLDPDARSAIEKKLVPVNRLSHPDFVKLIEGAEFLVTDGGSNQEEAFYMGIPTLILRGKTERIEGLGSNVVLSKNSIKVINEFIINYKKYKRNKLKIKTRPSTIIADYILK